MSSHGLSSAAASVAEAGAGQSGVLPPCVPPQAAMIEVSAAATRARTVRRVRERGGARSEVYSTVTDLARFLGWSTSRPRVSAISQASTCSGTVVTTGASSVGVRGTRMMWSA